MAGTNNPYSLAELLEWLESWAEDTNTKFFNINDYEDGIKIQIEKVED